VNSDWDLFLFCEGPQVGLIYKWRGATLDLTFERWPLGDGTTIGLPDKPIHPVKVLLDTTNGAFDKVLARTEAVFKAGPLKESERACMERLQKLDRLKNAIRQYEDDPTVLFHYIGSVYALVLRVWFEQHNLWPPPPAESFRYIQRRDAAFFGLLNDLVISPGKQQASIVNKLLRHLNILAGR